MIRSQVPTVAFIGLPNSGKSSLLNRLTGKKTAIIAKEAHTTRDLNFGEDFWNGMYIKFVDTGGLVPDPEDKIQKEVQIKSWSAISGADLLVWVIDRKQRPETISDKILNRVWKTGKPFLVAINKVDDPNLDVSEADFAFLGGKSFVNMSCNIGYGLDVLMDQIVENLLKLGFAQDFEQEIIIQEGTKRRRDRTKEVKRKFDGTYVVFDHEKKSYHSVTQDDEDGTTAPLVNNIICDLNGVYFDSKTLSRGLVPNPTVFEFLVKAKASGKSLYFLSSSNYENILDFKDQLEIFDGGIHLPIEDQAGKSDGEEFKTLLKKFQVEPFETVLIDDQSNNVFFAGKLDFKTILYKEGVDLDTQLAKHENKKVYTAPKIMFLGKPNVGKSSLFNAMVGKDLQIVTDIAGTTMSVNDTIVERKAVNTYKLEINTGLFDNTDEPEIVEKEFTFENKKQYILLDSVGIRRPGQRTFGAEDFATFRTIETAHQADILCLVLDGSEPISHQDQVVSGIAQQAHKGVVIIVNKADLVPMENRKKFIHEFESKFAFLKIKKYLWVSAKKSLERALKQKETDEIPTWTKLDEIWNTIDSSMLERETELDPEQVRKLFNYIHKKKFPPKQRNKKKAIIYDLLYVQNKPPTFHFLVKDITTIHWSYTRFLENLIRQNFDFGNTEIIVKVKSIEQKKVIR